MRTVFAIIPSLDYGASARQLTLLAKSLPRDRFRLVVCVLAGNAPWADELRESGVEVESLHWKRPFDLLPILALRRLIKSIRADVIHVWATPALHAFSTVSVRNRARLIVSNVFSGGTPLTWADRWSLRRAAIVTVCRPSEVANLKRAGVPSGKIVTVPWAVERSCAAEPAKLPFDSPSVRIIMGIGPLKARKDFRDAVWAFDILHYLYDDLRLVLVGDGPERHGLEDFCKSAGLSERVYFAGRVPDLTPWLERAAVVWSTSRYGSSGAILEAAAAERPAVAYRVPGATDTIIDGLTGYLVTPGDKPGLARQTRLLLDDEARLHQFGEAALQRVAAQTPQRLAEAFTKLYDGEG